MNKITASIIDDERLARKELKRILSDIPNLEIISEYDNGADAIEGLQENMPDVIFLDVEMPEINGFDLLEKIDPPHPEVIFITAYSEFAAKAFEVNAVDYVTKPIDPPRIIEAVERVQKTIIEDRTEESDIPKGKKRAKKKVLTAGDKVFIREGDRCWYIPVTSITKFESQGNYTEVYFDDNKPLLLRSLTAMTERLDPTLFFRANRSQVVNLNDVIKVQPWFSHSLKLTLKSGEEVEMSRRQSKLYREMTSL